MSSPPPPPPSSPPRRLGSRKTTARVIGRGESSALSGESSSNRRYASIGHPQPQSRLSSLPPTPTALSQDSAADSNGRSLLLQLHSHRDRHSTRSFRRGGKRRRSDASCSTTSKGETRTRPDPNTGFGSEIDSDTIMVGFLPPGSASTAVHTQSRTSTTATQVKDTETSADVQADTDVGENMDGDSGDERPEVPAKRPRGRLPGPPRAPVTKRGRGRGPGRPRGRGRGAKRPVGRPRKVQPEDEPSATAETSAPTPSNLNPDAGAEGKKTSTRSKRTTSSKPEAAAQASGSSHTPSKSLYYEGSSDEDEDMVEGEHEAEVEAELEDRGQDQDHGREAPVKAREASANATPTKPAPGSSSKNGNGKAPQQRSYRGRQNEVPAQYINTFTTVLDYPKALHTGASGEAAGQSAVGTAGADARSRSQRQSKVDALGRMDGKAIVDGSIQPVPGSSNGQPTPSSTGSMPTGLSLLPPMANPANGASSTETSANPPPEPNPNNNPLMKKLHVQPAPPLQKSSVKWAGPREPQNRTGERLFGLKECPTFYPTKEEFRDAMGYIRKIGEEGQGQEWGMVKIVPPKDWKMTFALNTETFRFQTRLQRLNSLEATSRAKFNFLDQLYMFHKQQGNPDVIIPVIDHRPLDVWALRKEVAAHGGAENITINKAWGSVARAMSYTQAHAPHLKSAYVKIVQPFDQFYEQVKGAPLATVIDRKNEDIKENGEDVNMRSGDAEKRSDSLSASPTGSEKKRSLRNASRTAVPSGLGRTAVKADDATSLAGRSAATVSPKGKSMASTSRAASVSTVMTELDEEELDIAETEVNEVDSVKDSTRDLTPARGTKRKRKTGRNDVTSTPVKRTTRNKVRKDIHYEKGDICEICMLGKDAAKILLCDECERGFHIYCLNPPLSTIPDIDEWYCPTCLLSTGHDYGFDEGEEHSLHSFQERANAFKTDWFAKHPPHSSTITGELPQNANGNVYADKVGNQYVTEDDVERQFWYLVESQYTSVEVEYGADIHSTTHGSAAPTLETHPFDSYAADPWNLNNLPILPQSLLRYIKSDISGMTVPWTYIGMLFSTFCWHNEDHHTYSINYQHFGDTKTWYTVPGSAAEKFEEAIRKEAPELFDQQPSLLYQLVTLLNPGRLKELGVDVNVCDQRPNEFVITWPKAYHCGFNHGFNLNEAVNFALPDWLPYGAACVQRYQLSSKAPVFSHEELLVAISQYSDTVESAVWIEEGLSTMIVRELEKRDQVRRTDVGIGEILDSADKAEDQYMCFNCKAFCYLSQVICSCTRQVACLDHGQELCKCDSSSRTLRKRFSESQLVDIQRAVSERASIPQTWRTRFESTLAESARPSVKALRALVAEGEKIAHPMPELSTLRGFVAQINSWMVRAGTLLNRKKASGRKRVRKTRGDSDEDFLMDVDEDSLGETSKKPAEEVIKQLLATAEKMAFDTPEIVQLRHLVQSIGVFRRHASALLRTPEQDIDVKACERMYMTGEALNVDTPELHQLDLIIRRKEWLDTMNNIDEEFLALSDVENYLDQAEDCEIPGDHEFVRYLKVKLSKGTAWRRRAEIVIAACSEPENNERNITLDELVALTKYDDDVPVNEKLASKLGDLLRKTEGVIQSCKLILNPSSEEERKSMSHIRKMLKTADTKAPGVIIPELEMVEAIVTQHDEWLKRVGKLVGETRQPGLGIEKLLQQTRQLLDPLDDHYPSDLNGIMEQDGVSVAVSRFNCVCRQPAKTRMYQCRKCLELYHLGCIPSTYAEEPNGRVIKCPFCRTKDQTGQKPQPRPSLLKFMPLLDMQAWKLSHEFEELTQIRDLVALCKHIGDLVLTHVTNDPTRGDIKTEDTRFLRHWLRKLRDLPINIEIETQPQSVSLYPALLSRLKQVRRARVQALIKPGEGLGLGGPVPDPNRRPSASAAGPSQRRPSTNAPAAEKSLKITKRPTGKDALEVARRRHRWPWMFFERWPKPEDEPACLCGGPDFKRPYSWHSMGTIKCSMCDDYFHHDCAAVKWWRLDDWNSRIEDWMCPFCSANFSRYYDAEYLVLTHDLKLKNEKKMDFEYDIKSRKKDPWKMCIDPQLTFAYNELTTKVIQPHNRGGWTNLVMERFEPGMHPEERRHPDFHKQARIIVNDIKKELTDAWEARVGPGHDEPKVPVRPIYTTQSGGDMSTSQKKIVYPPGSSTAASRPRSKETGPHLTTKPYQPSVGLLPTMTPGGYYSYGASYYSTDLHGQGLPPGGGYPRPHPTLTGYDPAGPMMYNAGWVAPPPPVAPPPLPTPAFGRPSEISKPNLPAEPVKEPPLLPPPRPLNSFTANMVIPAFKGGNGAKKLTDRPSSDTSYAAFKNASPALSAFGQASSSKGTPPATVNPAAGSPSEMPS